MTAWAQWRYAAKAYAYAPITWLRRVVVGRDPYWRQYFWQRWGRLPKEWHTTSTRGPVIWLEALSGGEIMQCVTLVRRLKARLAGYRILVATNNPHSHRKAQTIEGVDGVLQCPWDLGWVVRRVLRTVRPAAVVCIENPMFPVFVRQAARWGVPTLVCSGFMSRGYERHWAIRRTIALQALRSLTAIGAKEAVDAEGYARLGVARERIHVTGNLKHDRVSVVLTPAERSAWVERLGLRADAPVWVAGSVHADEDAMVLQAYRAARQRHPTLQLILAVSFNSAAQDIERLLHSQGCAYLRRSRQQGGERLGDRVLILDTFGELGRVYGVATVVFVGASIVPRCGFGYGHNLIEPLLHERPVLFGPFMNHWRDLTEQLKQTWPGVEVRDASMLAGSLQCLLDNGALRGRLAEAARTLTAAFGDPVGRAVEFIAQQVGIQRLAEAASPVPQGSAWFHESVAQT